MADLLLRVLGDLGAQPLAIVGKTRAASHQQRGRVLDVMERPAEEFNVLIVRHVSGKRVGHDCRIDKLRALGGGRFLQVFEKRHQALLTSRVW